MTQYQKPYTRSHAFRDLRKAAEKLHATVEDDSAGDTICLQVVAPDGYRWQENGGHHLAVSCYRGNPQWLRDAVADGLPRIASGLRPATPEERADEVADPDPRDDIHDRTVEG